VQRGRVSSLTTPSPLFPGPSGGSVPICATWMATSFRNLFPVESEPVCATWTGSSSRIFPRDVSVHVCATWAGTSSRPSHPSSSSYPLTHPENGSSVGGIDFPRDLAPRPATRAALRDPPVLRILRLAPRLAPRDLRCALRCATCAAPCVPRFAFPPARHDLHHALLPAPCLCPATYAPPGVPHWAPGVIFIPRDLTAHFPSASPI
jgi:hypothetical protein